ncbi:MAG: RNA polymerase sigma factor [Candidatus Acidiferrales bacterium]
MFFWFGLAMFETRNEKDVREFFDRWGTAVFTFCRLFLGNEGDANEATVEAFIEYLRPGLTLERKELPDLLLRCAVDAVKRRCSLRGPSTADGRTLESAIRLLPCEQRAVFILRDVLGLPEQAVATAFEFSGEQVRDLRLQALLAMRKLLPKDFWKEHTR